MSLKASQTTCPVSACIVSWTHPRLFPANQAGGFTCQSLTTHTHTHTHTHTQWQRRVLCFSPPCLRCFPVISCEVQKGTRWQSPWQQEPEEQGWTGPLPICALLRLVSLQHCKTVDMSRYTHRGEGWKRSRFNHFEVRRRCMVENVVERLHLWLDWPRRMQHNFLHAVTFWSVTTQLSLLQYCMSAAPIFKLNPHFDPTTTVLWRHPADKICPQTDWQTFNTWQHIQNCFCIHSC